MDMMVASECTAKLQVKAVQCPTAKVYTDSINNCKIHYLQVLW